MASVCGATIPMTKGNAGYIFDDSVYENVSMEAATVISNFQNVIVNEDDNEQSVKELFYSILDDGNLDKNSDEYINLKLAIDYSFELFEYLAENNQLQFALHLNSANDILIKKEETWKLLEGDAKKRRQSSEKSISVLTNGDLRQKASGGKSPRKRSDRKKMNIRDVDFAGE